MEEHAAEERPSPVVIERLVENHRDFLAFLERRVGSRAVAEDILQEAFARGIDKLATIANEESAVAWFYRVLRNAVTDHYRRNAAAQRGLAAFASEMDEAEPAPELKDAVCKCVGLLADNLKPEYADALKRIEVEGVSVKDYAARTGISTSNAGVRVHRAREALRKQVALSCGACADHGCLDCTCDTSKGGCG